MSDLCEGRVCVVTGAARGIGRAHVEALVAAGARVVVNDVDRAAVDDAMEELRAAGGGPSATSATRRRPRAPTGCSARHSTRGAGSTWSSTTPASPATACS